eukprot:TRINITY_DN2014_c0_g1_i1.p1 TRINITY_DN2014_c0_g1~~TRINITY_DN2014_c0_g1_i1.p1  ORF type:complete len:134 (+),score=34.78 TRINITY_DN2014_c0_g1_i1:163-564(+)
MAAVGKILLGGTPRATSMSSRFSQRKAAVQMTPSAGKRLKELLDKRPDSLGIRLGVKKRGCSGLSYTLDYAKEKKITDEIIEEHGVKVYIDPQALMTVIGTQMDFVDDPLKSEFVFLNPNAKSACGCGESFKT